MCMFACMGKFKFSRLRYAIMVAGMTFLPRTYLSCSVLLVAHYVKTQ